MGLYWVWQETRKNKNKKDRSKRGKIIGARPSSERLIWDCHSKSCSELGMLGEITIVGAHGYQRCFTYCS